MKPSALLALTALLAAASVFGSGTTGINGTTRQCTDPCFQAARGAFRGCAWSATGAFADALDGCLERHHECVDACRSQRQDCRDATGAGAGLAACQMQLVVEKARCRNQFRPGSIRLAACLDRADAGASACRRGVRRGFRQALLACQSAFGQCADACGPGEPPLGVQMCTAGAKSAFKAVIADCRQTSQASASACIGKDVMCVPDCTDARETCNAPTQAALNAAIAACTMQETTASLAADAEASKWQFDVFPYGWLAGNYGTVTVKGNTAHINVTPSDLYGLLEDGKAFAGAGYFAASYDRFSLFVDSMGGYVSESVDEQIPTPLCC